MGSKELVSRNIVGVGEPVPSKFSYSLKKILFWSNRDGKTSWG